MLRMRAGACQRALFVTPSRLFVPRNGSVCAGRRSPRVYRVETECNSIQEADMKRGRPPFPGSLYSGNLPGYGYGATEGICCSISS